MLHDSRHIHLETEDRKRMLDSAAKALAPGGILLYLGVTDIQEEPEHGIDPKIFAHADEVVADIKWLIIERSEEAPRMIDYGDGTGETEMTGVTVKARKQSLQ